ncbi:hypothetical protein M5K25_011820 [Dendrobium thyrsiflorum]|uniref:Trichome birefringence-like N-terminal domain-containing protein n=1 Tax=Dendrobium thyrsiflorum TaxID=117978 RepID=A0ABD0VAK8_DENTH
MDSQIIHLPFGRQVFLQALFSVLLLSAAAILLFISFYFSNLLVPFQNKFSVPSSSTLSTLLLLPNTSSSSSSSSISSSLSSFSSSSSSSSSTSTSDKKCNISKGEWIRDPKEPYYSNITCWMIQEHQNCMKYGRPDMEFLNWRWKPDGCELPAFEPVRFLELMRGKSLAFVGDSLARNHMQSLMCLLSRVEYPKDISNTSDENFKRMFYTNYNFTISIFWSPFLIKARETNPQSSSRVNYMWNLYLDEVDNNWANQIDDFNYLIISAGNWFTRPSLFYEKGQLIGCNYCDQYNNVTQLTLHYSHREAFKTAFHTINKLKKFKGVIFLRTLSPSHFENGEWNKGGNCVRQRPFQRNETTFEGFELEFYKAQIEEFRVAKEEGRKKGLEFRLLDSTEAMVLRPDGHPSRYGHWAQENVSLYNDCVHWCLPGPVDVWNSFLLYNL